MMTSKGCGHCTHMRGNGIMGSGPQFMKPSSINDFLTISNNFTYLNIHFDNMSGRRQIIKEISKFSLDAKGNILQEMWSIDGEHATYLRVHANMENKKVSNTNPIPVTIGEERTKWLDIVNSKIPLNIEKYTYYYPCFLITRTDNWLNSIKNNAPLISLTNAGKTRKNESGDVFLDKDGKSFNERMVDPKELITDVTSGKVKIEPHIVDSKETKKPEQTKVEPLKPHPAPAVAPAAPQNFNILPY